MVKDEIRSSELLRFGFQEIFPGEEVFFVISTKHFKNFEFEMATAQQDNNPFGRGNIFASKIDRYIKSGNQMHMNRGTMIKPMRGADRLLKFEYKPYADFDIVVWMILQISFNQIENETNPGGIRFTVKCHSENKEVYKEIDEKITSLVKEFEKRIVTRIILMELNETREWPRELIVNGIEYFSNFMKHKPVEVKKQALSVQTSVDSIVSAKKPKPKKVKKSRMAQWAEKMKSVEAADASPKLAEHKSVDDVNLKAEKEKKIEEMPPPLSKIKEVKEETKEEPEVEIPKYEIKLVVRHRYQSNINTASMHNLSILKNWEVNNMQNVFVIKNNYKTYVFTLTDNSSDRKEQHKSMKESSVSMNTDQDSKNIERIQPKNYIYLKIYGISEPDETFKDEIIKTIGTQFERIELEQKAMEMRRRKPGKKDYDFINEQSERVFLAFKIPTFIRDYYKFLCGLRKSMIGILISIEMGASLKPDSQTERAVSKSISTGLKRSFRDAVNRSSFFVNKPTSSSVVDPLDPHASVYSKCIINEEENEDVEDSNEKARDFGISISFLQNEEKPKTMKEGYQEFKTLYNNESFTLLYNGIDTKQEVHKLRVGSQPKIEKYARSHYGAALCNVIMGLKLASEKDFQELVSNLDNFAYPPIEESTMRVFPIMASQSEMLPIEKGHEMLKKFFVEGEKRQKLELNREKSKPLEFETEESSKVEKIDNLFVDGDEIEGIERRSRSSSIASDKLNNKQPQIRPTISKLGSREEIDTSGKNVYVFMHANYKGELKEERFIAFLATKINERIITEFDKIIEGFTLFVNQQKVINLLPIEESEAVDKT